MTRVEQLARFTSTSSDELKIQMAQTEFRMKVAELWQVTPGAKVLEVGCGQGDMTSVLADQVGEFGKVVALDVASPDYGAPLTLKQATDRISAGPLGSRVEFRFNFDVLTQAEAFAPDEFDLVVLSHCSWYFRSPQQLSRVLQALSRFAMRLCFSEWDLEPRNWQQMAHYLAVVIQGQVSVDQFHENLNVRTPLSRNQLRSILEGSNWKILSDEDVDSQDLQDGGWEVGNCMRLRNHVPADFKSRSKQEHFLTSQLDTLATVAKSHPVVSLSSYAIRADRQLPPI